MAVNQDVDGGTPASSGPEVLDVRLLRRLQEANEQLLLSVVRAHELAEKADQARADAEAALAGVKATERDLRVTAEDRERLLGMVGHDLRNPLSTIRLSAQLMSTHGGLTKKDANAVSRILRSVGHMDRMTRQILDFTRARLGGGLTLERELADLGALCVQAAEDMALGSPCPIHCESQGDVAGTWDTDRLMEVLFNIIGNATAYATPGTPILVQVRDAGSEVVVEISNQGEPIPAEQLPVLFHAFRRARADEPGRSGHLGLGLYIAHQIVLAHGGTLEARSAGKTTTFTISLPRSPPAR